MFLWKSQSKGTAGRRSKTQNLTKKTIQSYAREPQHLKTPPHYVSTRAGEREIIKKLLARGFPRVCEPPKSGTHTDYKGTPSNWVPRLA